MHLTLWQGLQRMLGFEGHEVRMRASSLAILFLFLAWVQKLHWKYRKGLYVIREISGAMEKGVGKHGGQGLPHGKSGS